jgi:hypothetical protein
MLALLQEGTLAIRDAGCGEQKVNPATTVVLCAGFFVSAALEGRGTMSVGRQWVLWLGLLLAAGMVMQVPGLVGIGPSGARAARLAATPTPTATPSDTPTPTATPTPSYTASLSSILAADGSCAATVEATWNDATLALQSVEVQVNDLTTGKSTSEQTSVSGTSGSQTYSLPLKSLLLIGAVNPHSFNAVVDFYSSGNSLAQQIYTNSLNGPCYLGQVPL